MFSYDIYCLENEEWKTIPGYEGLYEASSFGRVRSVDGKQTYTKRHGVRTWKGRILKSKTKKMPVEGWKVSLWKDGKVKDWIVARLICMAFYGDVDHDAPIKTKLTVNHKDGDRNNNYAKNLEWLTIQDNIKHAHETGLYSNCKRKVVIDLGNEFCKHFNSLAEASRYLGRSSGYISNSLKKNHNMYDSKGNKVSVFYIEDRSVTYENTRRKKT